MNKKALIVWGGWKGHTPKECADLFAEWLSGQEYDVTVSNDLDSYLDDKLMDSLSLVVPIVTMSEITKEQEKGLLKAIEGGVGCAGWHGGMCDSFRKNVKYQWMTGGQWVAHPGNCIEEYEVNIVNHEHEITKSIEDFKMYNTEQYYMHTDPSNNVLAVTTFSCPEAPTGDKTVMPVVWTRKWGKGRVFYSSLGHVAKDFTTTHQAFEIVRRGMLWASR